MVIEVKSLTYSESSRLVRKSNFEKAQTNGELTTDGQSHLFHQVQTKNDGR